MLYLSRNKRKKGTSLLEAVVAAIIFVPVTLFLLDLTVVILANSKNDQASKNAARAAANQPDGGTAFAAAQRSVSSVKTSTIIRSITIQRFNYPADRSAVTCSTRMVVQLPIPFPGFSSLTFDAAAVEPIVGGTN